MIQLYINIYIFLKIFFSIMAYCRILYIVLCDIEYHVNLILRSGDFPGGPMTKTSCSQSF